MKVALSQQQRGEIPVVQKNQSTVLFLPSKAGGVENKYCLYIRFYDVEKFILKISFLGVIVDTLNNQLLFIFEICFIFIGCIVQDLFSKNPTPSKDLLLPLFKSSFVRIEIFRVVCFKSSDIIQNNSAFSTVNETDCICFSSKLIKISTDSAKLNNKMFVINRRSLNQPFTENQRTDKHASVYS